MAERDDPNREGNTREWQDRARVVLNAKKAAQKEASQKQSPVPDEDKEEAEDKKDRRGKDKNDDPIY